MSNAYDQTQPYIPTSDSAFRDWLLNFSTLIAANPAQYGLDAADASILTTYSSDFDAAYQLCQAPSTRTATTVANKDSIRASANASVRVFAQMIKANAGVDNADKIALGIHVNDATPTPVGTPTTAPVLMIVGATSGVHEIRYADEATPTSRAKPAGAAQMQLNVAFNNTPITDPDDSAFYGLFTKQPVRVELDPASAGATATYFARWVTATGKFGPWSLPQSMTVAFGGSAQSQVEDEGTPKVQGGDGQIKIAA